MRSYLMLKPDLPYNLLWQEGSKGRVQGCATPRVAIVTTLDVSSIGGKIFWARTITDFVKK